MIWISDVSFRWSDCRVVLYMVGFCYRLCHCPGQLRSYCSCAACAKVWGSHFMVSMFLDCPSKQNWGKGIEMIEWVCVARHVGLMLTLWCGFAFCGFAFCEGYLRHVSALSVLISRFCCPKHLLGNLRYASRGKLEEPLLYYSHQSTYFLHFYWRMALCFLNCAFSACVWFWLICKCAKKSCLFAYKSILNMASCYGKYDRNAMRNEKQVHTCQSNLELIPLHTGADVSKPLMLHMNVLY